MKILIDMNLSPEWVDYLRREGYDAIHWKDVGSPDLWPVLQKRIHQLD